MVAPPKTGTGWVTVRSSEWASLPAGTTVAGNAHNQSLFIFMLLVALTGYGQASDRAASEAEGFDAHLTKPVNPTDLLELVSSLSSTADVPS